MDNIRTTFAENLTFYMKKKGLTGVDIAKIAGVSKQAVSAWCNGQKTPRFEKIELIAGALGTSPAQLLGWSREITELDRTVLEMYPDFVPGKNYLSDLMPVSKGTSNVLTTTGMVPVVEGIAAGLPVLAEDNIIDYIPVTVRNPDEYFALVVRGESMIGAGIPNGCKVLIHMQHDAEDGQIVACRVNGDEATLKRFKQKGDMVFLMPENKDYEPYIVPVDDFIRGDAEIIGVVKQVIIDMD